TILAVVSLVIPEPGYARGGGGGRSSGKSSTSKSSHSTSTKRSGRSSFAKSSSAFKTARYKSASSDRTYKAPPPRTPRAWSAGGAAVRSHGKETCQTGTWVGLWVPPGATTG